MHETIETMSSPPPSPPSYSDAFTSPITPKIRSWSLLLEEELGSPQLTMPVFYSTNSQLTSKGFSSTNAPKIPSRSLLLDELEEPGSPQLTTTVFYSTNSQFTNNGFYSTNAPTTPQKAGPSHASSHVEQLSNSQFTSNGFSPTNAPATPRKAAPSHASTHGRDSTVPSPWLLRSPTASEQLCSPKPNRKHISVVAGRRVGVYDSW